MLKISNLIVKMFTVEKFDIDNNIEEITAGNTNLLSLESVTYYESVIKWFHNITQSELGHVFGVVIYDGINRTVISNINNIKEYKRMVDSKDRSTNIKIMNACKGYINNPVHVHIIASSKQDRFSIRRIVKRLGLPMPEKTIMGIADVDKYLNENNIRYFVQFK